MNPLVLLVLTIHALLPAESGIPEGGGIVYSAPSGVSLRAPKGWAFDSRSGVGQGLQAVMYPVGSTWATATEVMYVNFGSLAQHQSLDQFIAADLTRFKQANSTVRSTSMDPIQVGRQGLAQLRHYTGDNWGNHEAVAYLQVGSQVALYVLSCRTEAGFTRSLPGFKDLVARSAVMAVHIDQK